MKKKRHFTTASLSRQGGRTNNEDSYRCIELTDTTNGCWIVADGLGGHGGGEIASQKAVEAVVRTFKKCDDISSANLLHCLEQAQHDVVALQKQTQQLANMRTTAVVLASDGMTATWLHLGDSRLYHFRNGASILFQTKDHSVPQTLVNAGDIEPSAIRHHEDRNRLLRVLGQADDFRPTMEEGHSVMVGDTFLLCTDGFWEHVEEIDMLVCLATANSPQDWLEKMERFIEDKNLSNHDNYTAIAIFVE